VIAHVVLFEPKPGLSDRERQNLIDGLRGVTRDVAAVRRLRVGRRIRHGVPGYEQLMRDDYSFVAIIEFDTIDDLRAYLAHPAHEIVGRHFSESSVRALAYDYRIVDAFDAAELEL
jgi:Stress responsive A/B Barrel Domain